MSTARDATTPVRVAHVLPHARCLGGTERTVADLLASPELAGVEQRAAFVQPGPVRGFAQERILVGPSWLQPPLASIAAILRWQPHIVHGWLLQGNLLGALLKALRPSIVLVTSERNTGYNLTPLKRALERVVARTEDVATANSASVAEAAAARVAARRRHFHVIQPGVAPLEPSVAPRSSTVIMVGRLHPIKDYRTALLAWRRVSVRCPDATLSIVGDGPERARLERLAEDLGLGASVSFLGEADPSPHLAGARLFLSTSLAEGFSRALIEALAAGLPSICTPVGGALELPRDAVRIVPAGDDAAVADAICDLLADDAARGRMAVAARGAASRFAPARCHGEYARLYRELVP